MAPENDQYQEPVSPTKAAPPPTEVFPAELAAARERGADSLAEKRAATRAEASEEEGKGKKKK